MAVFIRRAPVEDNTASEYIRTVAATYGSIVKFYNCANTKRISKDTKRLSTDTKRNVNNTPIISVHATKRQEIS